MARNEEGKIRFVTSRAAFAAAVEKFAHHDPALAVTADHWDPNAWLIATPGGTVDLRTGRLNNADPDDAMTKLTLVTPSELANCPLWVKFLQECTGGDLDLVKFLQQWCGYCATGEIREHALCFLYGPGGNGKTVYLNVVSRILHNYAVHAAMDTFTASRNDRYPTEFAMLKGARMVTASETAEGRAWAEARIKALTGGDPITAHFMRRDFFTFRAYP